MQDTLFPADDPDDALERLDRFARERLERQPVTKAGSAYCVDAAPFFNEEWQRGQDRLKWAKKYYVGPKHFGVVKDRHPMARVCERACAELFGWPDNPVLGSDGGIDFDVPDLGTVDLKSSFWDRPHPPRLLVPADMVESVDWFFLATLDKERKVVTVWGGKEATKVAMYPRKRLHPKMDPPHVVPASALVQPCEPKQ